MTPAARRAYIRGFVGDDVQSLSNWAVECMSQGIESPSLIVLAGLSQDEGRMEVDRYFLAALEELRQSPESVESESLRYAANLSQDLIDGKLSARSVAREIARVDESLQCRVELVEWRRVDVEFDLADDGVSSVGQAEHDAQIAAANLVSSINSKRG